jgi:branched-chain amino acid transport system ATP-binding protein
MSAILEIDGVTKQFGGLTALDDVFLDVAENSIVGLIGPNGAGKTTIFNAISGLVAPTSGKIALAGSNRPWPASHQLVDYKISRTLQGVGLFSGLSVLENVMMGADSQSTSNFFKDALGLSSKSESALRDKAINALAWAGALDLAAKKPGELTYPETKRVSIARALVCEPKIL